MKSTLIAFIILGIFAFASAETQLDKINQAIQKNNAAWRTGESWVTALSRDEFAKLCGAIIEPVPESQARLISLPKVAVLPTQLDWRENNGNWVTSVKNQGGCGSCWDFSATAQVEAWWQIFNDNPHADIDLSEQFVLSCSGAGSCAGGSAQSALTFFQTNGVPFEACLPYGATDDITCENACPDWQAQAVTIPGWGYVTLEEAIVDNIKQALWFHPVSASFMVYEDFRHYSNGVYEHVWGEFVGGHAILIVGWNDDQQCWICKNSWSAGWGEDGYFRIKWGDSGIGQNIPFIYDEMTDSALHLSPNAVELTLVSGEKTTQAVVVTNAGVDQLQFTLIDYEIPIVFHPDAFNAFDGSSWWCGDPKIGGYENHWLQYLDTPVFDLSAATQPELSFQTFWAIEPPEGATPPWDGWDGANVWISTDAGETFALLQPTRPGYTSQSLWAFGEAEQGWNMGPNIAGWAGHSNGWLPALFDLSPYRSQNVILRFAFASDMGFCSQDDENVIGFFIDDIQVVDGSNVLFYDDGDDVQSMQRRGFGSKAADWLHIENPGGLLAPGLSHEALVTISAEKLRAGEYEGLITVVSNDTTTSADLPVHLTVHAPLFDLAVTSIKMPDKISVLTEITPTATIQNNGTVNASNFDVLCEMQRADTTFYSETYHVDALAAGAASVVTFPPFIPIDSSDVHLFLSIQNYTNDLATFNDSLDAQIIVTNLIENFETQTTSWLAKGGWGITNEYMGYESEFAAHVNDGAVPYHPNMNATFLYRPALWIAKADSIVMSYWVWTFTEEEKDICYLEVSSDSIQWVAVDAVSGQDPNFQERHVLVSPAIKENAEKLWFRFHFKSNATEQLFGVLIDDIAVSAVEKAEINTRLQTEATKTLAWQLENNYPNPFNPSTTIKYYLAKPAFVNVSIFNLTGRKIETLVNEKQQIGSFAITWQPRDLASGVYLYKLEAKAETGEMFQALKKMLLVK